MTKTVEFKGIRFTKLDEYDEYSDVKTTSVERQFENGVCKVMAKLLDMFGEPTDDSDGIEITRDYLFRAEMAGRVSFIEVYDYEEDGDAHIQFSPESDPAVLEAFIELVNQHDGIAEFSEVWTYSGFVTYWGVDKNRKSFVKRTRRSADED